MTDTELLLYATEFELPRLTRIVRAPVIYPEGQCGDPCQALFWLAGAKWYVQRGIMLLHRQHGWLISNQVTDAGFLFESAQDAANFAIRKEFL